jgi:hypothetical protein
MSPSIEERLMRVETELPHVQRLADEIKGAIQKMPDTMQRSMELQLRRQRARLKRDTAVAIRERWGVPLICNDWHTGGRLQQRGFRAFESTVGAALSQHKFGRAADLSSSKMSADRMRADILANPDDPAFRFISRIEDGRDSPTWLHLDCGIIVRGVGEPIQVVRA